MKFSLSEADVTKLLEDSSAATRGDTARKVSAHLEHEHLSDAERELAEEIIRVMARDAELRVRRALSESLKDNPEGCPTTWP